ncbi:hypothetical protein [Sorangium sp. So ce385]|uniref:hypothetical protein n=1 Tax=Sorangium sp. So ce385 TaxID=3133308 RepID=UPI003F5C5FF5
MIDHVDRVQWTLGRIVSTLVERPGTIRYGSSQRRFLFDDGGETIELADLMGVIRRESTRVVRAEDISIGIDVLDRHRERFVTADPRERYALNGAGLALVRGEALRDEEVPADAISLRQHRSHLFYPANFLCRMDAGDPRAAMSFAESVRIAAEKLLTRPAVQRHEPVRRNMAALQEYAANIGAIEDPRLARLVEEQLLHNIMAHRAILRQKRCQGGELFIRITDLPERAVARYVECMNAPEESSASVVVEDAFMSTSTTADMANLFSRRSKKYKLIARSLGCGSRGRSLDGSVEGVWSGEDEVVFPPGTAFRVTRIEEDVEDDRTDEGEPRTYIYLQEISSAAARALTGGLSAQVRPERLFIYGVCAQLPRIIHRSAVDVAYAFAGQSLPAVLLSRRPGWDPAATALASPELCEPPLDQSGFAQWGEGLLRITVEPDAHLLSWPEFVAAFDVTPAEVQEVQEVVGRVRSTLDDCWLALEPVERSAWLRLEIWREGFDEWVEVELPQILPSAAVHRRRRRRADATPPGPPLDVVALSQQVQQILDAAYKQPFRDTYVHPRTGKVVVVRYSPFVEPVRQQVPRWTHGAMHAARATMWGLLLSELYRYYTGDVEEQLRDLLLAITHHDCAREDEGPDLWDEPSGARFAAYLRERGELDPEYCAYFADAIANKEKRNTRARQMVQAADCLDILRVSVFLGPLRIQRGWQPRGAFNTDQLDLYRVISEADGKRSADALLAEVHHFVRLTEVPELRVWFETRVGSFLIELLAAMLHVHERHGCYPQLHRWMKPCLEQVPAGHPTGVVADLLDVYFELITTPGASPVQVSADAPWEALWDQSRWRSRSMA